MYLLRSLVYQCHRHLKVDADRGYSHPMRPYEDFRAHGDVYMLWVTQGNRLAHV